MAVASTLRTRRPVVAFLGDVWWGFAHPGRAVREAIKPAK